MPETGARQDPFVAFRFEVRINGMSVGAFSECTGIQIETEVQDYNEGGMNDHVHKFPTRTKQSNIVLKRGIVDRQIWDWYFNLYHNGGIEVRDISIVVHDPSGRNEVMVWEFKRAFPCKWQGPDLNASQNNVAVETVEMSHQGLGRRK
jgi:phage tail-like protein